MNRQCSLKDNSISRNYRNDISPRDIIHWTLEQLVRKGEEEGDHRSVVEHRSAWSNAGQERDHGWCSLSSLFYLGNICSMINSSVSQVCQVENMTYLIHRACKAGIHACIWSFWRGWRISANIGERMMFSRKESWDDRNWERLIVNLQEVSMFPFFTCYDEGVGISSR